MRRPVSRLLLTVALIGALVGPNLTGPPAARADTTTTIVDYELADGTIIHTCQLHDGPLEPGAQRPVVLEWTNYNIDSAATGPAAGCPPQFKALAADLAADGYVFVAGQTRGVGASSGQPDIWSTQDGEDGAELVELLADQEWSNGKVGLVGCSSSAQEGLQVAVQAPPSLAAVGLGCFAVDAYRGAYYPGGLQAYSYFTFFARLGPDVEPGGAVRLATEHGDVTSVPTRTVTDVAVGINAGTNRTDSAFWQDKSTVDRLDDITAPMYAFGNWADFFGRGVTEWARDHLDPTTDRLVIAPGWHGAVLGEPTYGMTDRLPAWFDHHLRGEELPYADEPPVVYNELDGGFATGAADPARWRTADQWPPAADDTTWQRWHVRSGPSGTSTSLNDGILSLAAPTTAEPADVWTFPMANIGTTTDPRGFGQPSRNGAQAEDAAGPLTYTSPPLLDDAHLAGPVTATLHVSSTALDTDLVVRLLSVAPDGSIRDITNGWLKASHRALDAERTLRNGTGDITRPYHAHTSRQPLIPGAIERYDVELWPTATEIPAGHRLRLWISSQDPYFFQEIGPAANTLHHAATHVSSVLLPLVDAS